MNAAVGRVVSPTPPLAVTPGGHRLSCQGHPGDGHEVGLNLKPGGWPTRIAVHVRQALHHVVSADGDSPDAVRFERWKDIATQVLDRADADPDGAARLSVEEWTAIVECVADAAEYMNVNNYAGDHDFPEDAAAATLFADDRGRPSVFGLDICWRTT